MEGYPGGYSRRGTTLAYTTRVLPWHIPPGYLLDLPMPPGYLLGLPMPPGYLLGPPGGSCGSSWWVLWGPPGGPGKRFEVPPGGPGRRFEVPPDGSWEVLLMGPGWSS